jgi:type VI secretion system protein ImpL
MAKLHTMLRKLVTGVERLINSAITELGDNIFEMAWSGDGITLFRYVLIISVSSSNQSGRSNNLLV